MDTYNNGIGRDLAPSAVDMIRWTNSGANPHEQIALIIADAVRNGEMIVSYDDPRMENKECAILTKKKGEYYVWRTQEDKDVRWEHAMRNGQVFRWDSAPRLPGSDYGCRCWAEPLDEKHAKELDKVFTK